jgi:acetyl esterase/lipase
MVPVAADQPVPIQDFFRKPLWREPKLNPSGTHLAGLVQLSEDNYQLLVYDLEKKTSSALGGQGDKDIYHFTWLDDHRLVFFVSTWKLFGLGMFAVDIDRIRESYPLLQYCGATLVSVPPADRRLPLVWMRREVLENDRDGGVAVVNSNIKTGRFINLLAAGAQPNAYMDARDNNRKHILEVYRGPKDGLVYHYLADADGHLAFAFTSDHGVLALHRQTAERSWEKCPIDLEQVDIVAPGDQPGEVLALVPGEPGTPHVLRVVNAATGEPGAVVLADNGYDFDGWVYREPASRRIAGVTYHRDGPRTVWFDDGFRAVQKAVDGLFPDQIAQIIGNSEKGARFLIRTFSDRHPVAYHWVDLQKKTASLIRNTAPWIDPARMRPMQILKYKTRDGHQLDAYVTLPKGASKKSPVPLVVLPHGGPWARDTWGFDGEAQFLASRGYAVLQPNYRGSPGYDWMFPLSDQWEFLKMHDDVTDATKALLATGVIDPGRVAIMGASFGGYLALSGVVHEPSLYRCAVTIAGVFDWAAVLQNRKYDQFDNPTYARMLRQLGDPKKHEDKFEAISPLRHVEQVHVPVFVAHGKEDQVASINESRRLVSELEKYKVPHEKFFVGGEAHGMAHVKNQVELYSRIETFLAENLSPTAAAAGGTAGTH